MQKIGVEGSLTNIHQALREKGYDVVELNSGTGYQTSLIDPYLSFIHV